jgi:hypothetical protein
VAAGWAGRGTGLGAQDPVSDWAVVEVRAGEPALAEPPRAAALVGQEPVRACGIPVSPEVAAVAPGRAAELELVAGALGRVAEVELLVGAVRALVPAVGALGRALEAQAVGAVPVEGSVLVGEAGLP